MLKVAVKKEDLARRICNAAERVTQQLSDCGINQTELVTIEVVNGLMPNDPNCLGLFHCESSTIKIIAPEFIQTVLGGESLFAELPPAEFYDSLVAHEITHALAYQTRQGPLTSVADTEYVAFAMQLEFLSEETRTEFISKHPVTEPIRPEALNGAILAFAPAIFAIKAWKHFSQPENGCPFVRTLLNGDTRLSVPGFGP